MSTTNDPDTFNPNRDVQTPASNESIRDGIRREWERRRTIRYIAATVSTITALIYFMIGFNVISVLDTPTDQVFGFPAGIAFALGAVLLVWFDRRIFWILGAIFQVFVIYMYFNLAAKRSPAYEAWGLVLRLPQLLILVMLAYLASRWHTGQAAEVSNRTP